MTHRPTISSLWIGGSLSYLELLSLKSMMDWGHPVKLYHYRPLENVPSWLKTYDANEIMPMSEERLTRYTGYLSAVSNLFRYNLLAKTDEIWCDCDVYFLRPLEDVPNILVIEKDRGQRQWNSSLLRLPRESEVLRNLLSYLESDTPTVPDSPYFFSGNEKLAREIEILGGNGKVHLADLPWGFSGPRALSHFVNLDPKLRKSGWSSELHQPINQKSIGVLTRPRKSKNATIPLNGHSIHYFGSRLRDLLIAVNAFKGNRPVQGSFFDVRLRAHGIDPDEAPLVVADGKRSHKLARDARIANLITNSENQI